MPLVFTYIDLESDMFQEFSFLISVNDLVQNFLSLIKNQSTEKYEFCCFHPILDTLKMSSFATVA